MLPVLDVPTYELELLSKKDKIKFRPFLVKEQKVLMTALTTGEKADAQLAIIECAKACTFGKVDVDNLPIFDLERLFLYIRAKSVGETLDVKLKCDSCGEFTPLEINLIEMKVANLDKVTSKIEVAPGYGFTMAYPTAAILNRVSAIAKDTNDLQFYYELAKQCLLGVYQGDEFFSAADSSEDEIEAVLNALGSEAFEKVQAFFDNMPKVSYDLEFDCGKCSTHNRMVLEGTDSFFG